MAENNPERKKVYVVEYSDTLDICAYENIYQAKVNILKDFAYDILMEEESYSSEYIARTMLQLIEKNNLDDKAYIFGSDLIPNEE